MAKSNDDRGDGRDARGRWIKGVSGNLKGRPEDVPDLDMSDVRNFANEPMEITVGGEKLVMTRHEVVLLKTFQAALNGRISMLKYLLERFEQAELSAETVDMWMAEWTDRARIDPDSVPPEVVSHLQRALQVRLKRVSRIS